MSAAKDFFTEKGVIHAFGIKGANNADGSLALGD
jgi:hypothetical protein